MDTSIKTFEDACAKVGVNPGDYVVPVDATDADKAIMYLKRLWIIAKALNDGWKADMADTSQVKYYPWFWVKKDSNKPSGFGLSLDADGYVNSATGLGVRPYFKDGQTAKYAGTQFIGEFEAWAQYDNLSNQ